MAREIITGLLIVVVLAAVLAILAATAPEPAPDHPHAPDRGELLER